MRRNIRKIVLSISVLVLMLILSSCLDKMGYYSDEIALERNAPLLTPEELYELTGLTAEDFTELDVNEFINTYQFTKKNVYMIQPLYEAYFERETEPVKTYYDEYKYLFDSPLKKLEDGMTDQIKTVYVFEAFKAGIAYYGGDSALFDFKNKRVFGDSFTDYWRETTEEDREKLKNLINDPGIAKLKTDREGLGFTHEGYEIIIESEDGRIAHYKGEKTLPKKIENFCEEVLAMRSAG